MLSLRDPSVRKALASRFAQLKPDTPARWGKMTAGQMICHLSDSFQVGLGQRKANPVKPPLPGPLMKLVALYLPLPWPKNIPTLDEVRAGGGGTPPDVFERDRQKLLDRIEEFCGNARQLDGRPHPLFGKMSEGDWLRWGYLHPDHHLRQFGC